MKRLLAIFSLLLLLGAVACDEEATDDQGVDDDDQAAVEEESAGDDESDDADDGHTEGEHELADDLPPGESGHYGQPFTIDGDPEPLADAISRIEEGEDALEDIKVSARVKHVCSNRGCWMALEEENVDIPVRVLMYDYSFFVPRNAAGANAVVEGSIKQTTISEEEARHFAEHVVEQTGVDPETIEGEQQMYEFTATGIALDLPAL